MRVRTAFVIVALASGKQRLLRAAIASGLAGVAALLVEETAEEALLCTRITGVTSIASGSWGWGSFASGLAAISLLVEEMAEEAFLRTRIAGVASIASGLARRSGLASGFAGWLTGIALLVEELLQ